MCIIYVYIYIYIYIYFSEYFSTFFSILVYLSFLFYPCLKYTMAWKLAKVGESRRRSPARND